MGRFIDAAEIKNYEAATDFLNAGADANERGRMARTALMWSTIDRELAFAKLLLQHGADPDLQDSGGWTALHFAAQNHAGEYVQLLLDNGVDVNLRDRHGNGSLFRTIFNAKGDVSIIKMLLEAGADLETPNTHGVSARQLAETIADPVVVDYLNEISRPKR